MSRRKGNFTLVGLVSFGMPCDIRDEPTTLVEASYDYYEEESSSQPSSSSPPSSEYKHFGVYTAVAGFTKWLTENSDYKDCAPSEYTINKSIGHVRYFCGVRSTKGE